jgi:hypothetical protein
MPTLSALRIQIESALAERIPSALTPAPRTIRPVVSTGITAVDDLLYGGLSLGGITEVVGPECSGRTTFALSFLAQVTREAKVCAWIDVTDSLHPESAAGAGIDLTRLLWVRCGVRSESNERPSAHRTFTLAEKYFVPPPVTKGLHGGGYGPHPRGEANGLPDAVGSLLRSGSIATQCADAQRRGVPGKEAIGSSPLLQSKGDDQRAAAGKPWLRIEQALRVTDLLLQAGGFSAIVLDMGGVGPEFVSRVPLATWFRYRAAAERAQASVLLLTQHACAKSSAGLLLHMRAGNPLQDEATVFSGMEHRVEIARERFAPAQTNVIPLRKPPQSERQASWRSRTAWAGRR